MKPMRIEGEWTEGYVLDYHSLYSIRLPDDEFGHARFNTTRTEIGELLYKMKYNGHYDTSSEIIDICADFVAEWLSDKTVDTIIPVPPSTMRVVQPIYKLVKALAHRLEIGCAFGVLERSSGTASKNMSRSHKEIDVSLEKMAKRECNILLVNDLFDTGATANACVKTLRQDKKNKEYIFYGIYQKESLTE